MWSTWRDCSQILSYTGTVTKEEMYVEYLERLLSDIELHRYSNQGGDVCGVRYLEKLLSDIELHRYSMALTVES